MQTYTKRQRKDIHKALVAAKKYLWIPGYPTSFSKFICCAISDAYYKDKITQTQSRLAQDMIMDRLDWDNTGRSSLEGWVTNNISYREYTSCSKDSFQLYRWRWLESMIKEFSK